MQRFANRMDSRNGKATFSPQWSRMSGPLKHVAAELGVGLRTVQHHLTSLYKKTGTQTRTGLTARFIEESQNGAQARESHEEQPSEATRSASAEGASGE